MSDIIVPGKQVLAPGTGSGLIILPNGYPTSGEPMSRDLLGGPAPHILCQCGCGKAFVSNDVPRCVCPACKQEAHDQAYAAGCTCPECAERRKQSGDDLAHVSSGNLPQGMHRTQQATASVTAKTVRPKVMGEEQE